MLLTMLLSSKIQLFTTLPRWQLLSHPLLSEHKVQLWICRLDTSIAEVSGNKCLKLKYPLQQVYTANKRGIFTFGGAFSNHLAAVAASCHQLGLQSLAYVRTDKLDFSNPTLAFCQRMGMQLIALDRSRYRLRAEASFITQLQELHPQLLLVPEGGSSKAGAQGVAELDLANTPAGQADLIICPTASGGTLAGIINRHCAPALGIAVVRDASLPQRVQQLLQQDRQPQHWQINSDFTGAGYGRFDPTLLQFCRDMARRGLLLEPVYTGKALAGVFSLISSGAIAAGSRLSFFHTGGLQGLNGLYYRELITAADFALLSGLKSD
jgi:1-aminocyclopropane-1-carboxylate deaminase